MKKLTFWQSLLLAAAFLPISALSQPFNNIYSFQTAYRNAVHTDAVQITNGFIVEAGNTQHPTNFRNMIEMGRVGTIPAPPNGLMVPPTFLFGGPNQTDLYAVDLVECQNPINQVVQVANYFDPGANLWRIVVFRVNPMNGVIAWARRLGNGLPFNLIGSAVIKDANGNFYVLGNGVYSNGFMRPYLCKISPAPVILWEKLYRVPGLGNASHEAVDLLYDPGSMNIVFTTNRSLFTSSGGIVRDGIVTVEVNNGAGAVIAASHQATLSNTGDIVALDMDLILNNRYSIVGRVNTTVSQAFLMRYTPGLGPIFAPNIYPSPSPFNFWMTGVKPAPGGNMMTSFEWYNAANVLVPGMLRLNGAGGPLNPGIIYNAPTPPGAYIASSGLISLNAQQAYVVKGSLLFNNIPSLSLFAEVAPFAPPNPAICESAINVLQIPDVFPINIPFQDSNMVTPNNINVTVFQINGKIYDCTGTPLGSFRLAPPEEKEVAAIEDISIFPNPSDGLFTLNFSNDLINSYRTGEVYNALGEVVKTFYVNNPVETIDLSGQVPGIYLLRLKASDGNVSETKRIMIR